MTTVESRSGALSPDVRDDRRHDAQVRLEEAVGRFQARLIQYARQLLPDRADQAKDIVQMAFIRLGQAYVTGDEVRSSGSWLYRVTHNLAVDLNRRENRLCALGDDMVQDASSTATTPAPDLGPAEAFSRREVHELALRELHELPPDQRQVLLLRLIEGMTLHEISETTGASISLVHYRVQCGLRKLSQRFRMLGVM